MNRTRTIVVAFSTLDGIIQDPAGSEGTPAGGWVFRNGPEAVAGDRFKLGPALDSGVLLLGRRTWEQFAQIFPSRTGEFDVAMNRIPKLVASRTLTDLSAFPNSSLMDGDLAQAVEKQKTERDVIVMGSASVVHALAKRELGRRVPDPVLLVRAGRGHEAVRGRGHACPLPPGLGGDVGPGDPGSLRAPG